MSDDHLQTLLQHLRARLQVLISQRAQLGLHAPPHIATEISQARAEVARIKATLRARHIPVEDTLADDDTLPVAAPQTTTEGQADVFISYHEADEGWVSDELVPLLEAAGLRVLLDYRDFALGVARLINVERATLGSRRTLLILSPDWLSSSWKHVEAVLAGSDDPLGITQKLLPLVLRPCVLPRRLSALEVADLTDVRRRHAQLDRLVRTLQAS